MLSRRGNGCLIPLALVILLVMAGAIFAAGNATDSGKTKIYYFYQIGCLHCEKVDPFVNQMQEKYADKIDIVRLEIKTNAENMKLFYNITSAHGVQTPGTPTILVGDKLLQGDVEIQQRLEAEINNCLNNGEGCAAEVKGDLTVTLGGLITLAAVDSVNPCAIAVLVFLLGYLSSIGSTTRSVRVVSVYIGAVFLTYFSFGFGLMAFIGVLTPVKGIVDAIIITLTLVAGLINVKDFFFYGKWLSLEIPKSMKGNVERYMHNTSIPGAIVLGFFVAMVELPCTGGPYLAAVRIINTFGLLGGVPYLLMYNIIFVMPLIAIAAFYYRGLSPDAIENWREDHKRYMKLAMGLVLIIAGLALLFHWV